MISLTVWTTRSLNFLETLAGRERDGDERRRWRAKGALEMAGEVNASNRFSKISLLKWRSLFSEGAQNLYESHSTNRLPLSRCVCQFIRSLGEFRGMTCIDGPSASERYSLWSQSDHISTLFESLSVVLFKTSFNPPFVFKLICDTLSGIEIV